MKGPVLNITGIPPDLHYKSDNLLCIDCNLKAHHCLFICNKLLIKPLNIKQMDNVTNVKQPIRVLNEHITGATDMARGIMLPIERLEEIKFRLTGQIGENKEVAIPTPPVENAPLSDKFEYLQNLLDRKLKELEEVHTLVNQISEWI